jgi:hypothetical protein
MGRRKSEDILWPCKLYPTDKINPSIFEVTSERDTDDTKRKKGKELPEIKKRTAT